MSDLVASRHRAIGNGSIPILKSIEARSDLEKRIEELFDRELLDLAITRVGREFAPVTWDAFRLTTFEEYSGADASKLLGIPVASVFVAKHRVQKILKEEIGKLESMEQGNEPTRFLVAMRNAKSLARQTLRTLTPSSR